MESGTHDQLREAENRGDEPVPVFQTPALHLGFLSWRVECKFLLHNLVV